MTNEEAIKWLTLQKNKSISLDDYSDETKEIRENAELRIRIAYEMAIQALEDKGYEQGYIDGYAKGFEDHVGFM